MGALSQTLRDAIIPLVRSRGSPPRANYLTRSPAVTDRRKNKTKKTVPWLSSSRSERYGVVANQRQPNLYMVGCGGGQEYSQHTLLRWSGVGLIVAGASNSAGSLL